MPDKSIAKLIRGIFSLSVSSFIRIILSFLVTAVGARIISENDMGVFFLLLALVSLLETIGNMGLRISSTRYIAGATDQEEKRILVNNVISVRILTLVVVTILAWVCKPILLSFFPSDTLYRLYYYVPILFVLQLSESSLAYLMQGFQLYRKMAVVEIVLGVVNFVFVAIFLFIFKLGLEGLIYAKGISLLFGIIVRLFYIPTRISLSFNKAVVSKVFKFGLPLQVNDVLSYLIEQLDTLLVASLMDPINLAYMEIAKKIPYSLIKITSAINSVYFPHINQLIGQGEKEEAEKVLNNFLRIIAATTMFATFEIIIFQKDIMRIVFSEKYLPSAPGLGLFMLILSVGMLSQILDSGYLAAGYPAYVLLVNLTVASIAISGNLLMIPVLGFMGSIIARLIAEVTGNFVSFWAVRRSKLNAKLYTYMLPVLIMLACLGVYYAVGIQALYFKFLIGITYPILIFAFSIIKVEDLKMVYNSLLRPSEDA